MRRTRRVLQAKVYAGFSTITEREEESQRLHKYKLKGLKILMLGGLAEQDLPMFMLLGLKILRGEARMCLGNEYALPRILIFLHNIMKGFKWDLLIPDENVIGQLRYPKVFLYIYLQPRQSSV